MKNHLAQSTSRVKAFSTGLLLAALAASTANAATTYNWTQTAGGAQSWTTSTNWTPNAIPSPVSGDTVDFSTVNIAGNQVLTLGGDRTAEIWKFGDTSGTTFLTINTGNTIILAGATPTIDVSTGNRVQMSNAVSGSAGLFKDGGGILLLANNASSYTGSTFVTAGLMDFGGIANANIGGGSGRNITVSTDARVRFNALSNAYLNRIVENANEFGVGSATTSNNLDFSSSTGANLVNAFLTTYASNGAKMEYSGTITAASDNYRLGFFGQSGLLGIRNESALSGTQGLIVGGGTAGGGSVQLVGAKTFTGETVIRSGGRLGLAAFTGGSEALGLQNSALNVGSAGGTFWLHKTVAGEIGGSANTTSAVFGGLVGSRNLSSVYSTTTGANNSSAQAVTAITGFTLNVGASNTYTYDGAIGGFGTGAAAGVGGNSSLTKTGLGTQILNGNSTYTGATNVNNGTLVVNGSLASAVNVDLGANLGGTGTLGSGLAATGSVRPGNSIGTLNVTGNVTWNSGDAWVFELGAANTADLLNVSGNLVKGTGSAFVFDFAGSTDLGTFVLVDYTNTDFLDTDFSYTNLGGGNTGAFAFNGSQLEFTAAVPEPTSLALMGVGGLMVMRRRRA